jgi:hypothetical protein
MEQSQGKKSRKEGRRGRRKVMENKSRKEGRKEGQ